MQNTPENFSWAMKQIGKFAHMYGAPPAEQLDIHAEALLRLIRPDAIANLQIWPDGKARFTGDWLIDQMLETTFRFPNPIEFRKMYTKFFIAADGKSAADMLAMLEE